LINGAYRDTINGKAVEPSLHFQSEEDNEFEDNLAGSSKSIRKGGLASSRHFSNEVGSSVGFRPTATSEAQAGCPQRTVRRNSKRITEQRE
jgi:hypothetical protein